MLPSPPPERLSLPPAPATAPRAGFPLAATLAPVVVSIVLWVVTRSVYSLLFALLGPVVAIGSLADAGLHRRRAARREHARYRAALERTAARVDEARQRERARLAASAPEAESPAGWASTGAAVPVRVGWGELTGRIELVGEDPDDAPELAAAIGRVRAMAGVLPGAPIVVDGRDGIGIVAPPVIAAAVARAVALQVAAGISPAEGAIAAPPGEEWTGSLPHAVTVAEPRRYRFTTADDVAVVISWGETDSDLPLGCGTVLRPGVDDVLTAAEALTAVQANAGALAMRARAAELRLRPPGAELAAHVPLATLLEEVPGHPPAPTVASLAAPIGRDADGPVVVDLVSDGPHAVIAGMTGSGKSELLIAWVLAMAAGRSPDEVAFLLVDFKGGSAFAPLAGLPHVLATLSDLDTRLTRRAIESLRAELVRRERVLAGAGARAIEQLPAGVLPRLVIVVDEFAAVVAASPDLHEVFGDLAARGRSLGLHLVLCTQRPAGVIRDAVLANVALRLSLRVTDRGDSLAMLGSEAAARLPVDPRGRAILVHGGDPRTLQLAIAGPGDAAALAAAAPTGTRQRPWCDPLPRELDLDALHAGHPDDGLVFGLADLPAEQRQPVAVHQPDRHGHLLVLGASGAGSTTALRTLAASAARQGMPVLFVPPEPADAWAALSEAVDRPVPRSLVVLDDLDALVARFDADYRHEFLDRLTTLARGGAGAPCLVVAAHRLTGPLVGLSGLFGSRLLLRQSSRDEHVLAGGDPRSYDPDLPPGAGYWRGIDVQVARVSGAPAPPVPPPTPPVIRAADHRLLPIVAARPRALSSRLRAAGLRVIELGRDATPDAAALAASAAGGAPATVVLGDPDAWLSEWSLLSAVRRDGPLVLVGVDPADHRALLRDRTLPPPLGPEPGECWLAADGRTVRAILSEFARVT